MNPARADAPGLVILAAGASTRLGTPKALVELPGGPPLDRLARIAARANGWGLDALIVSGAHHAEIRAAIAERGLALTLIENTAWAAGRSGSLQCAVRARPGRDLIVAPVDVPCVPAEVFSTLVTTWKRNGCPARGWLAPQFEERFGHPIVLGRDLLRQFLALEPDTPLRSLRAQAAPLLSVPVGAPEILDDLDTPLDLERLRRRLGGDLGTGA